MNFLFDQYNASRFGLLSTRLLLISAFVLALWPFTPSGVADNPKVVTFLSGIPQQYLTDPNVMLWLRGILLLSGLLWFFCWLTPISAWVTTLAFAGLWALRTENSIYSPHIYHIAIVLTFIHAAWFTFYNRRIVAAIRNRTTAISYDYPAWVFGLSVFYIGWFHTLAGIAKLRAHGWQWADGVSLQLWTKAFGYAPSPVTQWIVSDQPNTMLLQQVTLVVETAAILCVLGRPFRWIIGLSLLAFYAGVLTSFIDYGFHLNAILVLWFLLLSDFLLGKWQGVEAFQMED